MAVKVKRYDSLDPGQINKLVCPEIAASPSLEAFISMAVELTDRGLFGKPANRIIANRSRLLTVCGGSNGGNAGMWQTAGTSVWKSFGFLRSKPISRQRRTIHSRVRKNTVLLIRCRSTAGVNTAEFHL